MQQVIIMHHCVVNALYETGARQSLNHERVAANETGQLTGLYFDNDEVPQSDYVTDNTWEEYFGALAAMTLVSQASDVVAFDIDLAWGVDRVLPTRLLAQYRAELVDTTASLLLAVMAQENPQATAQLEKLKWHKLVAVRSHYHLTEFTFGEDVRIEKYMELLDEYAENAGAVVFEPVVQYCQVASFLRGFRHAASVPSSKRRYAQAR